MWEEESTYVFTSTTISVETNHQTRRSYLNITLKVPLLWTFMQEMTNTLFIDFLV